MAKVGIDAFIDELVKMHLKQVDPQATDDVEQTHNYSTNEIVFFVVVLGLACFMLADVIYPYMFPKSKEKRKNISKAAKALHKSRTATPPPSR
mmetsp:Transcript_85994/g.135779  ORF Transcript_85994/g.135779 Transcript_85994/m.135779 type:complete len:93 (+) Transcript_85994:68-346(+)|eukprot:CAMPEP_0169118960 /NCGR_PEP_ID=MMETSP1015-20121227/31285_1 /TAXON_ID=342587 /ORGANISM="Karlodinium micrum, Strain CCMP2283" /LENGTH=92 /DNA_ID=CAMNT_0009181775 /DNA_START=68 /DNA_END=346 /DNA_ORIENTATION=+